jgi:Spy/CpxP family protein refolding chaperone
MKTHSTKRFVTALGAALLIAVAWPLTVSGQQAAPQKPQTQEQTRMGRMGRNFLNLTPEQEKKLQDFRDARMKDRTAFRDEMMKMREEMRGLNKDPQANAAKIDGLIDQMFKLRADQAKTSFKTRAEIMNIFTPEQREKLKGWRENFRGRAWFAGRGGFGFAGPRMGFRMGMGAMGPSGWGARRMGRRGMFRRHPFFWMFW